MRFQGDVLVHLGAVQNFVKSCCLIEQKIKKRVVGFQKKSLGWANAYIVSN